jgi:hypothetical protein
MNTSEDRSRSPHRTASAFAWARRVITTIAVGITAWALPGIAAAQTPTQIPKMFIQGASVFEGNTGTRILSLPVGFIDGPNPAAVTGFVQAIPLSGNGFSPATGAAVCGAAGVDFEQFTAVPFTIPPNTPNGTLTVNIRICSDSVVESDEHIFVALSGVSGGAVCLETCAAIGTIRNDDGTPTLRITGVNVVEPTVFGGVVPAFFVVTQSFPSALPTTVNFATRDGTARAGLGDYVPNAGTLVIPAGATGNVISVLVRGDPFIEAAETFFVDLSSPTNALVAVGTGQGTIFSTGGTTGSFAISPGEATVRPGEAITYNVDWQVPPNRVWRNLKTIDLRVRSGSHVAMWVRWDEASNRFALCEADRRGHGIGLGSHHARHGATCGNGELPGTAGALLTELAQLDLAGTAVVGSGPTGASVRITLPLTFGADAAGRPLTVELAATDDLGNQDAFVRAGELRVQRLKE